MSIATFPIITTERLILRKFTEADTDVVHKAFSMSSFTEPMLIDRQPDRIFAETYISELLNSYSEHSSFTWAISLRENGVCIGAISFEKLNSEYDSAEIGYWVTDEHKGNGYATEAVKSIIQLAFKHMHLHRVYARCSVKNVASVNVLKNAGFQIEGISRDAVKLHGEYISLAWFSIIN